MTLFSDDDILQQNYVGLSTNISLENISLNPGTRCYFTVMAVNAAGLQTGSHTDGFVIDTDNPNQGVVFNTLEHTNDAFRKSATTFERSWHGFEDHFTGIQNYMVAFSKDG